MKEKLQENKSRGTHKDTKRFCVIILARLKHPLTRFLRFTDRWLDKHFEPRRNHRIKERFPHLERYQG